jgi:HK97 family phage prohead protease
MKVKKPLALAACLLKFDSDTRGTFTGYASVFNGNDSDNDTILPGAFKKSIKRHKSRPVKGFINHKQHEIPVIDWVNLSEDSTGLEVSGRIDFNHTDGESLYSAMERGAMDAMSIGFKLDPKDYTRKERDDDDGDDWRYMFGNRNIKNMDLMEISVVTFPADDAARVADVKSELPGFVTLADFERYLRDACGFSKSAATAFIGRLSTVVRGDPVPGEVIELHADDEIDAKTSEQFSGIAAGLRRKVRKY